MACLPGGWIADRAARRAPRGALRRHPHRGRPLRMALPSLADLLSRPHLDRGRHRAAEGQRQRHRRRPLSQRRQRRDAGFSIFYMGINLGAFIAPLVCGYLGQRVNWHVGFGAAGVGMMLGVIQYVLGARHLGDAGLQPAPARSPRRPRDAARALSAAGRASPLRRRRCSPALLPITAKQIADGAGYVLLIGGASRSSPGCSVLRAGRRTSASGSIAIGMLFVAACLFWSEFEQAGSTLNLFARPRDAHVAPRLDLPEQLVPVAAAALHHHVRAGLRLAVAAARLARCRAVEPDEVRDRPAAASGAGFALLVRRPRC